MSKILGVADTGDNGRSLSGFWSDLDFIRARCDPGYAYGIYEDFCNTPVLSADSNTTAWASYIDTSNTITQVPTEVGGVVRLETDATDNDGPVITTGGDQAGIFKIVSGATGRKFWYEARVRVSSAALAEAGIVIGLTQEGVAADNGVMADNPDTDTNTMLADIDVIGFASHTNAAPTFAAAYQKSGQTAVVVEDDVHTIALNTWVKLGMKFDPDADRFTYYVNGEPVDSFDVSAAGTTTFPSGEELAVTFALKNGDGVAKKLDVDWVMAFQLV